MTINGRYIGGSEAPAAPRLELDLRIDVSERGGPRDRVSADVFEIDPPGTPRRFIDTWVVESPEVQRDGETARVTGPANFLLTGRARVPIEIAITDTGADVVVDRDGKSPRAFACTTRSSELRSLEIVLDVTTRAGDFIHPDYDTGLLPGPAHPRRRVGIRESLGEAGIAVTSPPPPEPLNDDAAEFESWSDAELHDALAVRFLAHRPDTTWPQWSIWALQAGSHDDPGVSGVMFDNVDLQQRQGLAIFRRHEGFLQLPAPAAGPPDDVTATAMRAYAFTWIHELGHALNLEHSWERGRANDLSWMNSHLRFDDIHGRGSFWREFPFAFVHDELLHLRHGALSAVIPGGAPFNGNGQLREFPAVAGENAALELLLRPRASYRWLAPVTLEVRLRNLLEAPTLIDTRLHPEAGRLAIFIRDPNGIVHRYAPLACKVASPEARSLAAVDGVAGEERFSTAIDITYGANGFSFRQPGDYTIRGYYYALPGGPVVSQDAIVRVDAPAAQQAAFEHAYFRPDVGACLYLGGSQSPRLRNAFEMLRRLNQDYGDDLGGADLASAISKGVGEPFFGLRDDRMVELHPARPDAALAMTERAFETYGRSQERRASVHYRRLTFRRVRYWKQLREPRPDRAAAELAELHKNLQPIVNPPVLATIETYGREQLGRDSPFA